MSITLAPDHLQAGFWHSLVSEPWGPRRAGVVPEAYCPPAWTIESVSLEQNLPYSGPAPVSELRLPVKGKHVVECILGVLLLSH